MEFQVRSPLKAKTALAALESTISNTPHLKGTVSNNRFSVRVANGPLIYLPSRGLLQGRIIQGSNGSIVEGSFNKSYVSYGIALVIVMLGLLALFYPSASMRGGGQPSTLLIAIGLAGVVIWLVKSDKDLLKREIIKAVQGTEIENQGAS